MALACLAARRFPGLAGHPLPAGAIYGVAVWVVMNFVVIPLSAASRGALSTPVVINGFLIHIFGVGIPSMLFARLAGRAGPGPAAPGQGGFFEKNKVCSEESA